MGEYKIEIPHFYCLEYSENTRKMMIDIDFREPQIVLSCDLIQQWEKPHERELISKKEKRRIIKNIYNYLLKNNSSERVMLDLE